MQPAWSFGRDKRLLADCRDLIDGLPVLRHYCESDIDLNRTTMAFSGDYEYAEHTLLALAELVLPSIDLNRHVGASPRIGALDACQIVPLESPRTKVRAQRLRELVAGSAESLAERFDLPVFLCDRSEVGRPESELQSLRKGGFGGLLDRMVRPDFGPQHAHPNLGATMMGWRDFSLTVATTLHTVDGPLARSIADRIRKLRTEGDPRMLGVKAMSFALASRDACQVWACLTMPNLTTLDPILEYIEATADAIGTPVAYHEIVGVIRPCDVEHSTIAHARPEQVLSIEVEAGSGR